MVYLLAVEEPELLRALTVMVASLSIPEVPDTVRALSAPARLALAGAHSAGSRMSALAPYDR